MFEEERSTSSPAERSDRNSKTVVIIAAGGSGTRFGQRGGKQYFPLLGKPIMVYSLEVFQASPLVDAIVIATAPDNIKLCRRLVRKYAIGKVAAVVKSGTERYDSVKNALKAVPQDTGCVLVHDGSRPLINEGLVERIVKAARRYEAVIPVLPVTDTVKMVGPDGLVTITLNRQILRAVQTPQGFDYKLLCQAYRLSGPTNPTDDASLVEEMKSPVLVVEGLRQNIKITYPEDIGIAECFLRCRRRRRKELVKKTARKFKKIIKHIRKRARAARKVTKRRR